MTTLIFLMACFAPDMGCVDEDSDGYSAGLCYGEDPTESLDDDQFAADHPEADEACDGRDNDGDGEIDEDLPDSDGDGDPDCSDCEPASSAINHDAVEVWNGEDDDCDGQVDDGVSADVSSGTIQDILRERTSQDVDITCAACSTDSTFGIYQADPDGSIEVTNVAMTADIVTLSVTVSDDAPLGFYGVAWQVRDSTGFVEDAVRLSRGKVAIDSPSLQQIKLNDPGMLTLYLDGQNFVFESVVTITDTTGQSVTCAVDYVVPSQITCHFDSTAWALQPGEATIAVRDEADAPNCNGYTQACVTIALVQ